MGEQKNSGFCKACNSKVLITRPGVNHLLHLILTIITLGVWIVVWVLVSVVNTVSPGGWRCSQCGSEVDTLAWSEAKKELVSWKGWFLGILFFLAALSLIFDLD